MFHLDVVLEGLNLRQKLEEGMYRKMWPVQ